MVGLKIRKLTLADKNVADGLLCSAFAGINPGGIIEREVALAPETSLIAFFQGGAVGLVCAIEYGHLAYVGPMAVSPKHQGKGIGRALFQSLVNLLTRRGSSTMMLDATEAGEPLYRKFGFEETARTFDMSREAGLGISLLPGIDELDRALAVDRDVFGANRESMLRRLLEREGAALYTGTDGYLVAQTKVLGPFVAREPECASDLLDRALNQGAVASRVLAPMENPSAVEVLTSRGFHVQREVKHMRHGRPVGMRRDLIYGLASFAVG